MIKTHQQISLGQIEISNQLLNDSIKHRHGISSIEIMNGLIKAKGVSALFTGNFLILKIKFLGLVPRIAKVAPACAIMIGSYEYLKLFFSRRNRLKD